MLAGEVKVANRHAFVARNRSELAGAITGIGALGQRIGRPMFQVNAETPPGVPRRGRQGAGKILSRRARGFMPIAAAPMAANLAAPARNSRRLTQYCALCAPRYSNPSRVEICRRTQKSAVCRILPNLRKPAIDTSLFLLREFGDVTKSARAGNRLATMVRAISARHVTYSRRFYPHVMAYT
jgi:hypothetical protein